jgi:hypothetical protein
MTLSVWLMSHDEPIDPFPLGQAPRQAETQARGQIWDGVHDLGPGLEHEAITVDRSHHTAFHLDSQRAVSHPFEASRNA